MLGSNQYYGGSESRQELAQALRTKKNKGDSMRILLIEDDISVAEFVVKGLKERFFS
jgi:ATP-dependent Clp protease adapter protein ClpS